MSRGNLLLLGALVVAVGAWLVGRDWERDKPSAPPPRLFPEFSKGLANRIEISGGPSETAWTLARKDQDWTLASAGGYPAKAAEADRFLDAVANLRKENEAGGSEELRKSTMTDEKGGRLVRVLQDERPVAEFYVGKKPEREWDTYFVRKADDKTIYRTRTLLTKDRDAPVSSDPYGSAGGFPWHSYLDDISARWVDPAIWDLGSAEVQEIWLGRAGLFKATLRKEAQDKWQLIEEGKEPVPADADVADGIFSVVRRLSLYDILGSYDDARKECGLEEPETTLVLTLKKKVEKPAPKDGEPKEPEPKEGEGKPEEKKEEYVTFTRSVEIGKKFSRPEYDEYSGETKSADYYAVHIGPEKDIENKDEKSRAGFIFLIRDYTAGQIRKELLDLHAKPKEGEAKGPGEGEGAKPGDQKEGEKPADGQKPGEEKPKEEKPAGEKPADEKPAGEKPADDKPAGEKPADEKPADEKPAGEKPAGEKPAGEGAGQGDGTPKDVGSGEKDDGCGEKDPGCGCGDAGGG